MTAQNKAEIPARPKRDVPVTVLLTDADARRLTAEAARQDKGKGAVGRTAILAYLDAAEAAQQ